MFRAMAVRPIRRVLVANRGEIAVRVMRTCRERGISTVAVYSDVDRLAPHVQCADAAVAIGPAQASQSYLVIDKIIDACRASGADAVHPGYGFLSENEDFADACTAAGITFIGPSADAMRRMGSKTEARKTVSAAGTPVVPGDNGPEGNGFPTGEAALSAAKKLGFPVLCCARPRRAVVARACAWSATRPTSSTRSTARAAKPRPRSATAPSTSRRRSSIRATSRSRCSATPTATSCTSASATARCSAATRR
jgi:acetyl-CoA carboxylase biotin carboxylase subunit